VHISLITTPWRRLGEWRCTSVILNLWTGWGSVVSLMPLTFYSHYPLRKRPGGLRNQFGPHTEAKNLTPSWHRTQIPRSLNLYPSHYTKLAINGHMKFRTCTDAWMKADPLYILVGRVDGLLRRSPRLGLAEWERLFCGRQACSQLDEY
jgi:hypothetical protein